MRMQTQLEWEAEMAGRVLDEVRTEIYLALRYLDGALARLGYAADLSVRSLATDGEKLFYPPEHLLDIWKKNPVFVNRAYLHTLLHCIFLHLWTRSGREKVYWDTACDIVAEGIIDSLHDPAFKRPVSWTRQKTEQLRKSQRLISPAAVYSWLLELPEDEFTALRREYYTDDHRYWPDEQQMAANPSAGEDWKRESSRVQSELETHGSEQGDQAEAIAAQIKAGKSRRSYREFLRRFCALREEIKIDPDSFDPGLYTYGLSLYGNLPLIEPQETREAFKVQELAIVIDTSMSCSGELVRRFLESLSAVHNPDCGLHFYDADHLAFSPVLHCICRQNLSQAALMLSHPQSGLITATILEPMISAAVADYFHALLDSSSVYSFKESLEKSKKIISEYQ